MNCGRYSLQEWIPSFQSVGQVVRLGGKRFRALNHLSLQVPSLRLAKALALPLSRHEHPRESLTSWGSWFQRRGDKRLLSMALFLSGQLAPWAVEQKAKARKGFSGFREFLKRQGL